MISLEQLANLRDAVAHCRNDQEAREDLQALLVRGIYEGSWLTLHKLGQCYLDAAEAERPTPHVDEGSRR